MSNATVFDAAVPRRLQYSLTKSVLENYRHPHPLNRLESYRFKTMAGALLCSRAPLFAERALLISTLPKSFICNTYGRLASVANTGLTIRLSPLDATLTKNWGGAAFLRRSDLRTFNAFSVGGRRGHWELARESSWCRFL